MVSRAFMNGNEQTKSHTEPRGDSTGGSRHRIVTRNRFIANDIRAGQLSDLVLCGLLSRNTHRDESWMDWTRANRNQHWIFVNLKASKATTDYQCEELAMNAKEWLVGLYGLDNGHIHRCDHGHDHSLCVCGGNPSIIQWPARSLLGFKNEGSPLGDTVNQKCWSHASPREKVGAACHQSVNGHSGSHDNSRAINAQ